MSTMRSDGRMAFRWPMLMGHLARIDYRGTGSVGGALARTMPKVSM